MKRKQSLATTRRGTRELIRRPRAMADQWALAYSEASAGSLQEQRAHGRRDAYRDAAYRLEQLMRGRL